MIRVMDVPCASRARRVGFVSADPRLRKIRYIAAPAATHRA
jgi:hypothetical protein